MGGAIIRRFALFSLMLLMLLFLPAGMVAQTKASSSKYIAMYDSDTETLTFEKYEGESLPSNSAWVKDGMLVFNEFFDLLRQKTIKHIVLNESFKTFTPTTLSQFFAGLTNLETITGLEYLNTANVTNMTALFDNCRKLTSLDLSHFNTAKVTNMYRMFADCRKLTSLDLSNFNTAKVTDMEFMFRDCSNLKTIYASENFITAAVTYSNSMFASCNSLSGDIDWSSDKAADKTYAKTDGGYFRDKAYDNRPWVKYADGTLTFRCGYKKTLGENEYELNRGAYLPAWETNKKNISRVVFEASFANARPTSCYAWFQDFNYLEQIEGIENLNTENVTSMKYMFRGCSSLTSLDVTHFNTGNVTSMFKMFSNCFQLTELDVTHFNTANVEDMSNMFYSCSSLTSLDVTHFNTANVENMSNMFYCCFSLTSLDVTHFNTENVTSMSNMFYCCSSLTSLDVTNFNTANVTNMSYMFFGCNKLKEIYVSDKFVTDAVTKSQDMFSGCDSLSGELAWTSDKVADKTYATLDGGYFREKGVADRPWVKYADGTLTFRYGFKRTVDINRNEYELNSGEDTPEWNTSINNIPRVVFDASFANARPTTCFAWFRNFTNLTQIEGIENLNTEKVTDMSSMFSTCVCLKSLDVTNFNTANVKDMGSMFFGCRNLAELDLSNFNTANVEDMRSMFSECKNLAELDLSNFNTAKVMNMANMFSGCLNLTTIYVNDDFVITQKSYNLFYGCTKLKGAIDFDKLKTNSSFANYKTGYFTKLVGKNGDEKIGAAGKTLATENLVLEDSKDFVAYEPFAAKAASYSRTVEGTTWATLCLPFEVSLQNQNFRAFKLLSADDAAETVELEEIETSIAAGTPVIIKMNEGATLLSFSEANKAIAKDVLTSKTDNGNYQLQGLYTQKVFSKDADNNCYIVKGEKLMNPAKLLEKTATEFVGSKPFRAYMVDKSPAPVARARMFSIRIGDGTTAIKQLEADAADTADGKAEYYDLQGHRLQDLQKGVNIVKRGGKTMKVVIK